jgi:hypothetical protein
LTYSSVISGIHTLVSAKVSGNTVLKALPYRRAGASSVYYVFPNIYNSTPTSLRRVNKTFTINIVVEKTCGSEADYISLWGDAEKIYEIFEILDDYVTINTICFKVNSIYGRYYKEDNDMAYVAIQVILEQLSDE